MGSFERELGEVNNKLRTLVGRFQSKVEPVTPPSRQLNFQPSARNDNISPITLSPKTLEILCRIYDTDLDDKTYQEQCMKHLETRANNWIEKSDLTGVTRERDIQYSKVCYLPTDDPQYLSADVTNWNKNKTSTGNILEDAVLLSLRYPRKTIYDAFTEIVNLSTTNPVELKKDKPVDTEIREEFNHQPSDHCKYTIKIEKVFGSLPALHNVAYSIKPCILLTILSDLTRSEITTLKERPDLWDEIDKTFVYPWMMTKLAKVVDGTILTKNFMIVGCQYVTVYLYMNIQPTYGSVFTKKQ